MSLCAGSFLVHDECQDTRCLTVRGKDSITHYKIQSQDGLFFIVEQTKFKMLQDLVYHYTTHQSSGVLVTTLRHPYYVPRGDDEVSRGDIQLTHKIGKGNYGDIWHGVKGETHVAVKIQNQGLASKSEFLQEATVLSQLDHPKIIHCEGVCSSEEPAYLLTEFLKFGNLVDYLQKGEGKDVHFLDLVSFGLQVAMGMAYLERQGYIHCDLAARSVAVGEGKLCKIQNFERARRASCYKLPPRTSVPVRWTAPEVCMTPPISYLCFHLPCSTSLVWHDDIIIVLSFFFFFLPLFHFFHRCLPPMSTRIRQTFGLSVLFSWRLSPEGVAPTIT